jgi:cytochrome c biogenesis protein CcdA
MFQPIGLIWGAVTLIFGILVIIYPKLLRYTVGIYLIIVGMWAIIPRLHFEPGRYSEFSCHSSLCANLCRAFLCC